MGLKKEGSVQILIWVTSILYIIFVLVVTFRTGSVKINDRKVKNPLVRGLLALIVWPAIGLIFWVFGLIGNFLLMPFGALLGIAH